MVVLAIRTNFTDHRFFFESLVRVQIAKDVRQCFLSIRAEEPYAAPYFVAKHFPSFAKAKVVRFTLFVVGIARVRLFLAILESMVTEAIAIQQYLTHISPDLCTYVRDVGNDIFYGITGPFPQTILYQGVFVVHRLAGGDLEMRLQDLVDAFCQIIQRQSFTHTVTIAT